MKKIDANRYRIPKEWRDELFKVEMSKIRLGRKLESSQSKGSLIPEKRDGFMSSTVSFFGADYERKYN